MRSWSPQRLGVTFAIISALGFSFKAILVKLAYAVPQAVPVDAVTLLALRMLFALPVFVWVALRTQRTTPPLTLREWLALAALGMLGYYGASVFDFIGLQYISAGLERLIIFTYPTLTLLIGVLFMGKAIRGREIGALLLSYAGIGLAFMHDLQFGGDTRLVLIGAFFVFASSISYALYLSGSAPMIQRLGAARFTALAVLASTISTLLHFLLTQPVAALNQPVPVYAYAAAMSLFSTILPVFMLAAAIRHIGSTTAALIGTLGPVLTVVFSWWLLDEPISLAQMAGTALVLGGVLLVSSKSVPRE